ncbi:LacI family DNA-binding transcriptional regulator [Maribacter polysiphoniae]|uniref:LacI family DNA-binding transcriptional regulator n=1 Tax=Maribacter polysiphoniae TaxID=429344 RepID=A0A316E7B7_9FLAO|nr:LacI family DNA-binding transcriptional regulator [Maribacter polysiphoniae]MBD1260470.1 LacI family DNA-binding transcriptional regulator [Maribacter polysiphoniae]PWK25935.1 LacI family transcriptional regulator [Maribacter polysiphoniae]
MKPKMTLKRIAKELGVSISTVSKALHDNKEISQDNRDKIQAFAKFYNYRPNNIALSLKNKKTKTLGLIIPDIVHNFFSKVISGIEHVANLNGYNVIIAVTNESFDKEVINMELLVQSNIDGFIMSLSKETLLKQDKHHLQETINQGIPIVMFDRVLHEIACDKVIVDDVEGSRIATQKLIDTGCKKILLLTTGDFINIGKLRTQGYLEALGNNNITPDSDIILKINDLGNLEKKQDNRDLERDINQIFEKVPDIDGVFAVNEIYAIKALNVARQRGLRVPEDLSVVSFSDGILSQHSWPSLTTISQHGFKMGERAASILINRLALEDEEKEFVTEIIKTELIERDSTR